MDVVKLKDDAQEVSRVLEKMFPGVNKYYMSKSLQDALIGLVADVDKLKEEMKLREAVAPLVNLAASSHGSPHTLGPQTMRSSVSSTSVTPTVV